VVKKSFLPEKDAQVSEYLLKLLACKKRTLIMNL